MEEEQAQEERNVLANENDGGNGNLYYRNEHRSVFLELTHSSSEAGHSFVMGHHQEGLGNLIDLSPEAMRRTREKLTPFLLLKKTSTMSRLDASSPPHNDPTQNGPVPENHLQVSSNVEASRSNAAGPSGGHSFSSPETLSNSRKRKRESDFPSCSFDSPEMEESPSKRRRSDSRLGWNNNLLSIGDEKYYASTMPHPDASTLPQNDSTQNDLVPEKHLEVSNNVEAHSSNAAGPSGGQSSSSPETQSTSRKRKRRRDFNSPETDDSPSKRKR
ncbi:hypothetical protein MHYP_G00127730 [Metynnis hypsauchen]